MVDGDGRPEPVVDRMENRSECKRNWAVDNRAKGIFVQRLNKNPWKIIFQEGLALMNRDKVGAPYRVPDSVIHSAMLRFAASGKGYRDMAAEMSEELKGMDHQGLQHVQGMQKELGRQ